MSAEEQEMMSRIQQLTGRIDRQKKRQQSSTAPGNSWNSSNAGHRNSFRARPAPQGFDAPAPARGPQPNDSDGGMTSDASGSSWVKKQNRHLQLINTTAYKKNLTPPTGARPGDTSRIQKKSRTTQTRTTRVAGSTPVAANTNQAATKYEVVVEGIRFHVSDGGKKLIRIPGQSDGTPKTAVVADAQFQRTKSGNLIRFSWRHKAPAPTNHHKVDEPCKFFSTTGSCPKGPRCRYQHHAGKVAICKSFLQGQCSHGDSCDLSHDATPERVPTCVHYAKGSCSNPDCLYAHVNLAPAAQSCRPFGLYGYCEKGESCLDRHSFECPDFSNTGECNTRGCKLIHRERASVLRRAAANAEMVLDPQEGEESSDIDSDASSNSDPNDFINPQEREYIGF